MHGRCLLTAPWRGDRCPRAEKQQQKKQKAKTFANNQQKGKAKKNAGRWA